MHPYGSRRLPPEILDLIASWIDKPSDILNIALASKACRDAVVPRHTEYRVLRCQLRSSIWAHLSTRKDLAHHVRAAELLCLHPSSALRRERIPTTLVPVNDTNSTDLFSNDDEPVQEALKAMDQLEIFHWYTDFIFVDEQERSFEENIWDILKHCSTLKHLGFYEPYFNRGFDGSEQFRTPRYPLWSISNLTSMTLCNAPFLWDIKCGTNLQDMLKNSPGLESLSLQLDHRPMNVQVIFSGVHWTRLRELSLRLFADPRVYSPKFARFLEAHPTLVDVEWQYLAPQGLNAGSLPSLRHLHGEDDSDGALHFLSGGRAFESVGEIPLNPTYMRALRNIDGGTLRKLELRFFDSLESLRRIADMFPALQWLRIPSVDYLHDNALATHRPIHVAEWPDVLRRFAHLEVFHGVSFFKDPRECDENDMRAEYIVACSPTLRRVDHWDPTLDKVIVLTCTEGKVGWKEMLPYEYELGI